MKYWFFFFIAILFVSSSAMAQIEGDYPNGDPYAGQFFSIKPKRVIKKEAKANKPATVQNNKRRPRFTTGKWFSILSQRNAAGYTHTPKERKARWLKLFYPGRYQANTPTQKRLKEFKASRTSKKYKGDITPRGGGMDPRVATENKEGGFDSRLPSTPKGVSGYKDKSFRTRDNRPDKSQTQYKDGSYETRRNIRDKAVTNYKDGSYESHRNIRDKAVTNYKDGSYETHRNIRDKSVTNYKDGSYETHRNVRDKSASNFSGNMDRVAKRNSKTYTLNSTIGGFQRKQYKQRSHSVWQGEMTLYIPSDPSDLTEFQGYGKQKGKKRTPARITLFGGTIYDFEKRDNTEFTLWEGFEVPFPFYGPGDYSDWEGYGKYKGKPGPNESAEVSERNVKMRTQTLWRNEFGHNKRFLSKPTYSKSEKGIWAE